MAGNTISSIIVDSDLSMSIDSTNWVRHRATTLIEVNVLTTTPPPCDRGGDDDDDDKETLCSVLNVACR